MTRRSIFAILLAPVLPTPAITKDVVDFLYAPSFQKFRSGEVIKVTTRLRLVSRGKWKVCARWEEVMPLRIPDLPVFVSREEFEKILTRDLGKGQS